MFRIAKHLLKRGNSDAVDVSETNGVRALHLGSPTIQSAMRIRDPNALELTYTRGMMCFLLFNQHIKDVLAIGLGGGSLAKYMHAYCPEIISTVVEINPNIIQVARNQFYVPANDARLQVIEGDGLQYLADHANGADVLLIDAFDSNGIPPDFCSHDFFDLCARSLKNAGIFAINLWGSDRNFDVYLQRIEHSFQQKVLILRTGRPGNIVVFGFNALYKHFNIAQLQARAKLLESTHRIEFNQFLKQLMEDHIVQHNQLQFKRDDHDA